MNTTQTLAEWAQQMADTVQHKARAKEQRHQVELLDPAQAKNLWVKGMDQVVQTLEVLVPVLKHPGHFPQLSLVAYARTLQGTTTYMHRGMLLSLKGLEREIPTIEFEIDPAPPFRPDLLAPTVRVTTPRGTAQATLPQQEHFCFGVSLQGVIVWQPLNPLLRMSSEGSVEEMLRSFLSSGTPLKIPT